MKQEFVPYEVALRLKALGFDEPCIGYRDGGGNLMINYTPHSVISAPTYSQAFRWFREKYSLIGSIDYSNRLKWYYVLREFITSDILPNLNTSSKGEFKSYGEAELACLDKLLEIVESKK